MVKTSSSHKLHILIRKKAGNVTIGVKKGDFFAEVH